MRRRWKQPVSVVSKSLKSLLLRRKLDDPVQFFFVVRTPNSHLELYLRSIVVAKQFEERIWTNGVASKIVFPPEISVTRAPVHDGTIVSTASVFQLVHPGTGALLHVERVIFCWKKAHFSSRPFWFGHDFVTVKTAGCPRRCTVLADSG